MDRAIIDKNVGGESVIFCKMNLRAKELILLLFCSEISLINSETGSESPYVLEIFGGAAMATD